MCIRDRFDTLSYSFYLFPKSFNEKLKMNFTIGVPAIEFLNKCNTINFNKWIKNGIPFVNKNQKEKLIKNLFKSTYQDMMVNGPRRKCYFR